MSGAYFAFARGVSRLTRLRMFRVLARPLGDGAVAATGLQFRMLDEREALALCADPAHDLREDGVRAAFARGDACAAAFDGAALAGYSWFAFSTLPHLEGVSVEFPADGVWTYKALVFPSHRGRGIAPLLYRFADAEGRRRGRANSLICVEEHNAPSIAAARRAGYVPAGRAAYRVGGGFFSWHSAGLQRLGVRFFLPR